MNRFTASLMTVCLAVVAPAPARARTPAVPATTPRHHVLVLGDSVLGALRWVPESLRPLWRRGYDITLETWGCQALLAPGCPGSGGRSAVERLAEHRDDAIDTVVVGTGYNDTSTADLRRAMRLVVREARRHGASVLWLTYERRPTIMVKSRRFNSVVWDEAPRHRAVTVADWASHCRGHGEWFNGDGVHLVASGAVQLGRFLAASLDRHVAAVDG